MPPDYLARLRADDVGPASGTHDGYPFVSQELEGFACGVGRDVIDLGEVVGGGESLSRRVLSAGDPLSQVAGDLYIGRGYRAMINHGGMLPYLPGDRRFTVRHGGRWRCYRADMGPDQPGLHAVGGTDDDGDQVKRCKAFITRHRKVSVLSPKATGTGLFHATWPEGDEGMIRLATHEQLGPLLDYLEARFDR